MKSINMVVDDLKEKYSSQIASASNFFQNHKPTKDNLYGVNTFFGRAVLGIAMLAYLASCGSESEVKIDISDINVPYTTMPPPKFDNSTLDLLNSEVPENKREDVKEELQSIYGDFYMMVKGNSVSGDQYVNQMEKLNDQLKKYGLEASMREQNDTVYISVRK